jgi:hypothetical protein
VRKLAAFKRDELPRRKNDRCRASIARRLPREGFMPTPLLFENLISVVSVFSVTSVSHLLACENPTVLIPPKAPDEPDHFKS